MKIDIFSEGMYIKPRLDVNAQVFSKPSSKSPKHIFHQNQYYFFLGYFYLEMEKRRQLGKINIECLISNIAHHFHF